MLPLNKSKTTDLYIITPPRTASSFTFNTNLYDRIGSFLDPISPDEISDNVIMLYREPFSRYISGLDFVAESVYRGIVNKEVLNGDYKNDNITSDEHAAIVRHITNLVYSNWMPNYTLYEPHLLPSMTLQLISYIVKPTIRWLHMRDYTSWSQDYWGDKINIDFLYNKSNGPAGFKFDNKRDPDIPTKLLSFYSTYIEPVFLKGPFNEHPWCLQTSFNKFIWYEKQVFDLVESNNLTPKTAEDLFLSFLKDPWFLVRSKELLCIYTRIYPKLPQHLRIEFKQSLKKSVKFFTRLSFIGTSEDDLFSFLYEDIRNRVKHPT